MKFKKLIVAFSVVAGMSMLVACGSDDSSSDAGSGSGAEVTTVASSAIPAATTVPTEFPREVPVITGGRYRLISPSPTQQSLEVSGLRAGDWDRAVGLLTQAGFTRQPGQEDLGSVKSATFTKGGRVVALLSNGAGDTFGIVYTTMLTSG
ncbi:hypothetical protein QSJ18_16110 [Gordonia sp. ABSL1-1]|uniref:hypothetical protein n=1 Tax=Gordonia sp. ABSL1-1 TaxID=3053923 RepID=UPI0025731DBB|nr:hypothetical protein [Gordonia sp. ABSL1-1]MDL9938278.1 hypothetical protein [Gordonia sp. ABSL1-1]